MSTPNGAEKYLAASLIALDWIRQSPGSLGQGQGQQTKKKKKIESANEHTHAPARQRDLHSRSLSSHLTGALVFRDNHIEHCSQSRGRALNLASDLSGCGAELDPSTAVHAAALQDGGQLQIEQVNRPKQTKQKQFSGGRAGGQCGAPGTNMRRPVFLVLAKMAARLQRLYNGSPVPLSKHQIFPEGG